MQNQNKESLGSREHGGIKSTPISRDRKKDEVD
jgi:hypothetical protein